jgi:hypothetical protein
MPKVRDLGINVIPATMRPLEIGPGGGKHVPFAACGGASNCMACVCDNTDIPATSCDPSGCPAGTTKDKDKKKATAAIGPEAVLLLQQQLRARISEPRAF